MESVNVVIGGEAGQGLVTVGELLAKSLVRAGYHIVVTQSYMSRIRGGHNTFAVRFCDRPVAAPQETIDLLVALNEETLRLHGKELTSGGLAVADETMKEEPGVRCLRAPFATLAPGNPANVAALGVAGYLLNLDEAGMQTTVLDYFGARKADLVEGNRRSLTRAYAWASSQPPMFPKPAQRTLSAKRLMMNGNDAIALGALSVGVKFCAFYPMTPSTSIPLILVKHASEMGLVVEQAEDEIAAINMAIGASFVGAPAMVATAGGGFALMTEGVSLAGMTETPVVIVVGQRPAPATGLPTRTEQGDLELVLRAGHGEFPRAVFSPGSVEECFHLTSLAFRMAEKSQGPVFVLTDQFLADSYRAVEPFALPDDEPVGAAPAADGIPYRRYRFTESGVSPRLFPGAGHDLVVADSDEHTEDGHITEDLDARRRMVEKRLRKIVVLRDGAVGPNVYGEKNPELLLVCWGSPLGAAVEAAQRMNLRGRRTGVLHFPQVWPLVPERFMCHLLAAREVVFVEGNATGQFARILRGETGFAATGSVRRYDGLPMTPEFVMKGVESCLSAV